MISNLLSPILGLITKVIGPLFLLFAGKKLEQNKNLKAQNEAFKNNLGMDDDDLARRLRERGDSK